MSRMHDIIDNHEKMDQLVSILKHHGVNTEYLAATLIETFKGQDDKQEDEENQSAEVAAKDQLVADLTQFYSTF